MGEFFPYTHDFGCAELTQTLARLGCWTSVEPENYTTNCLWNSMQSAGVADHALQAMKSEFLQRKISRQRLKKVAEQHNLRISLHTCVGSCAVLRFGPEDGFGVELALFKDHYIHLFKTQFNSYAVRHYDDDEVRGKKSWWTIKDASGRRDAQRGMSSLDLLRCILETPHARPIDITTDASTKARDRGVLVSPLRPESKKPAIRCSNSPFQFRMPTEAGSGVAPIDIRPSFRSVCPYFNDVVLAKT